MHFRRRACCRKDVRVLRWGNWQERVLLRQGDAIFYTENEAQHALPANAIVSMNFWGAHPDLFRHLEQMFSAFVTENAHNPKAEFYIPTPMNLLIKQGEIDLTVIPSEDKWYGVTYKEDRADVVAALQQLTVSGKYPTPLFS